MSKCSAICLQVFRHPAFRLIISAGLLFFLFLHLSSDDTRNLFSAVRPSGLIGALVLLPLNFGIETLKWQGLIKNMYPQIHFGTAFRAVLEGCATGIFTPNRLGDYAGRLTALPSEKRIEAAVPTFWGRLTQAFPTFAAGLLGFFWLIFHEKKSIPFPEENLSLAGSVLGCLLIIIYILFRKYKLKTFLSNRIRIRSEKMTWRGRLVTGWKSLTRKQLWHSSGWAFVRYGTFSFQYVILCEAFGSEAGYIKLFALTGVIFGLKSMVPSPALAELGIREAVALSVFRFWNEPFLPAVQASLALYVINLVIPSIAGAVLIAVRRYPKRRSSVGGPPTGQSEESKNQ